MTKGPGGYVAAATDKYWDTIAKQDAGKRDEDARQRQLAINEQQLKLQQDDAKNKRLDTLSNGLSAIFNNINTNARHLDPEVVTQFGAMQSEYLDAEMERNTTGNADKLIAWQKKYPGGQISLTRDGVTKPYNFTDAYREIQTKKPRNDLQDELEAGLGKSVTAQAMKALDLPGLTEADTTKIAQTMRDFKTGAIDPYLAGSRIAAVTTMATPENLLDNLVLSDDPKDLLMLKGRVDGMRARYKGDAAANATLDHIAANYDPALAPPELKAQAERRAQSMALYGESQNATLKAPIVALDAALFGNRKAATEVKVLEGTFASIIDSTNALNNLKVGDAGYQSAKLVLASKLLGIENVLDRIGIMANIAKQGGQGVAALNALRADPQAMGIAGITEADIDSALTRANQTAKAENRADVLADTSFIQTLTKAGIAGVPALAAEFKAGRLTEDQADEYIALAKQYGFAESSGLNVIGLTNDVEGRRLGVVNLTIEDVTREQIQTSRTKNQAEGIAADNEVVRQEVLSQSVRDLTGKEVSLKGITLSNGYMLQAYSLTEIRANLAAGLPGQNADTVLKDLLQKEGASENAIIVQDGQEQYLARLTTLQMQNLVKGAKNNNLKLDSDGRYIVQLSDLNNQLGVATATTGIAQQKNLLSAANTLAQYVPKLTAQDAINTIAGLRASTQEKTNLFNQLAETARLGGPVQAAITALAALKAQQSVSNVTQAEATATLPYVPGTVAAQQGAAQAQADLTTANAANGIKTANILFPLLDKGVTSEFYASLATNDLTKAKAILQQGNLKFDNFTAGADTVSAVAGILTFDEANAIPSMSAWMKANGIDSGTYNSFRKFANKPKTNANGQPVNAQGYTAGQVKDIWQQGRVKLNQEVQQTQTKVTEALNDGVFKGWVAQLKTLGMPSTDVDALTQSGWSLTAIDANPEVMKPKYAGIVKQIKAYRTTVVDPLTKARDEAQRKFADYPDAPPPFNPGGGSDAPTTAPAGTRVAPPAVKTTITQTAGRVGTNARNLYALLGAESEFGTNTSNYKGMDQVGIGQIAPAAQADVNKRYGLKLDRNNPAQNMEIAARYFQMQLEKYGNDPIKAYIAYNWGAGNLDKHLARTGGKVVIEDLPEETQTGIKNFNAGLKGFDVKTPIGQTAPATPLSPGAPVSSTKPGPVVPKGSTRADAMFAGREPSSLGFTASAIYPGKNPDGSLISYCTRFAREYAEKELGLPDRSMPKYFGATATITRSNFSKQGALYLADQTPVVARQFAGQLKQGDMVFLAYAKNPSIDHMAVYDGNGGFIQHSLPGFQGTKIEGAVNRMTVDEFFTKMGNATVSYGRVPGMPTAATTATVKPPASTPAPTNPTPAKPTPVLSAPAPTFQQVGKIKIEPSDRVEMFRTVQFIGQNLNSPDLGTAKKKLATLLNTMKQDGYDERDIRNYLNQIKTQLKITF